MDAGDLKPEDQLRLSNGALLKVLKVDITDEPLKAFNLTVDQTETYFVGETGAWVHNCPETGGIGHNSGTDPLKDLADEMLAAGQKRGAVSEYKTIDGKTYRAYSGEVLPGDSIVGKAIGIRDPGRNGAGCSEMACMQKAIDNGSPIQGGTMRTLQIGQMGKRQHGDPKPACDTCDEIMKDAGIEELK